jgi:hypothetical protein
MTSRERISAVLVLVGGLCLVAAAGLVSGLWGALAAAGVLMLALGIGLGLEETPPVAAEEPDDVERES